ncbi:MAG: hypothetical protein RLZZ469_56, partial [Bacteroidota bacterium]
MKKNILFLCLFFTGLLAYAQDTASLKKTMQQLYEANYLMDFEAIAQLSYPKMVDQMGKDTFLEK